MVGIPIDGNMNRRGLFLKWKALKTKFMDRILDQMKALEKAGNPRRYGMSIEGVVKETDPIDPTIITKAYIRNVALTPHPVNPHTWVKFAKSLSGNATVSYNGDDGKFPSIREWVNSVVDILSGVKTVGRENRYFKQDGSFKIDGDINFFKSYCNLDEAAATWCSRFALSRQSEMLKSINSTLSKYQMIPENLILSNIGDITPNVDPYIVTFKHLRTWKSSHPNDVCITNDGRIAGGDREVARHFLVCENRPLNEVRYIVQMLHDSPVVGGK